MAQDRRIAAGLFVLTFVTYAWFFNGGGWNQNAHFDLARALVERQTLHIDGYRVNTGDISWTAVSGEWHAYINKPPGVSFLAAIPYALVYAIERAMKLPVDSWALMTVNAWIVTVLTCGVAGALIPVVIYGYGRRRAGASPLAALGVALAIAFGTIVFPYSTMLFAHVPSALFLLLAFVWLDERPLLAGIAAGIAGASTYLCIPAAAILLIGAWTRGGPKAALRFALGGLPAGILLLVYQFVCFGSPLVTAVEVSEGFTEPGLLFGVFRPPSLEALWGLTCGDHRGLFFVSPVLLLAFAGVFRMTRSELALIGGIMAVFLFAIASFNQWSGGWAFGPRYLLPIVPLMGIPMLYVRGRAAAVAGVLLGVVSFGMQLIATAVDPMPSSDIRGPVQDYLLPRFLAGDTAVNPQSIDEIVPHDQYPPGSHQSTWASFNLGELLVGRTDTVSLVPIVLWLFLGGALLSRKASVR